MGFWICIVPLLEKGYGQHFDKRWNQYTHYLEAMIQCMDIFTHDYQYVCESCNTAIENNSFSPKYFYVDIEGKIPVVFDSSCTIAVMSYIYYFMVPITKVNKRIKGLSTTAALTGEGYLLWMFLDDYGVTQRIELKVYLVPTSSVRLFNPQCYFKQEGKGSFMFNTEGCVFDFSSGNKLIFKYSSQSSLTITMVDVKQPKVTEIFSGFLSALPTNQLNISKSQE